MARMAEIARKTSETEISLSVLLDSDGNSDINTGISFFDHMLTQVAKHGFINLSVNAQSFKKEPDGHHVIEDTGIALGKAIKDALGEKNTIKRYGTSFVPMDDALAMVSIDLSGRAFLVFDVEFCSSQIGDMTTQLIEEFFRALAFNSGMTLHIRVLYGKNDHHKAEAIFKAFGKAFDEASREDDRIKGIMSTKGLL